MKTSDEPIIVEETYRAPVEQVWNALTDVTEMRRWYFDNIPEFKPEAGFETEFIVKSDERTFSHRWKVTEVEPFKSIKYSWEFEGYPGRSTSVFELSEAEGLTKLKLTVEVYEDFPDDIPEFKRESCIGGWKYFLKGNLKRYLEA